MCGHFEPNGLIAKSLNHICQYDRGRKKSSKGKISNGYNVILYYQPAAAESKRDLWGFADENGDLWYSHAIMVKSDVVCLNFPLVSRKTTWVNHDQRGRTDFVIKIHPMYFHLLDTYDEFPMVNPHGIPSTTLASAMVEKLLPWVGH